MAEKEAPDKNAAAAAAAAGGGGGAGAWMPVIAVVVLVPVLSYAMAMFVIAPQMEKRFASISASAGATGGEGAHGAAGKGKPGDTKAEATYAYEFKDIVSNLAGSMRSRYIKVTFTAYSANPNFTTIVEEKKAKLLDATIGVLARLSLADLEDASAKNKVRNEIVYAMESVLRERVVEEIYFSEFVVQ